MNRFVLDLEAFRGDSFDKTIRIKDKATRQPIDLSGSTWAAQARKDPDDVEPMFTFEVDTTNAAQGELTLRLTPEQTTVAGQGLWDLQSTSADQPPQVLTRGGGKFGVRKDITR